MKIAIQTTLDWKKIVKNFQKRSNQKITLAFLKKRYKAIKPAYKAQTVPLSSEDDQLIIKTIEKYGLEWKKIYEVLPKVDPVKIRNRYYSKIKKEKGEIK